MVDDWRDVTLEQVADELTVGHVGPMASEYVEAGIPMLRSMNVDPLVINTKDLKFITPEFHQRIQKSRLSPGDVVIVRTGKPGACAVIPNWLPTANCSDLVIVRCGPELDNRFLAYYVNTVAASHVSAHLVGAVQQHFNVGSARTLRLRLPPLAEQKAIAAVLGALDDKIELNRRMNATLEAMARALFQSWFVDFDPVRAKLDGHQPFALDPATAALFPDSFRDSPLGHIPTGWDALPLYDTAQWVNGAAFKNEDFCTAGVGLPVIKIGELKDGIGAQTKWCQRDAAPEKIIDTGDLVYSWSGSPDTSLEAFLWSGGRGLLNQHIFKVISPTAAEKRFVYYLLQYLRPVLVETARNKQTTGLGHVTIADMKRLLVCMPSKAVLAAFDRTVTPIFDKAFTNTLESRTLATLRDTLLPKLLSGEISVAGLESKPEVPL
jgi:type I restriction enzyme S subunit